MPNWCSNRMYFSGEPAQIAEIKRLASGAVTPFYRRATNEGNEDVSVWWNRLCDNVLPEKTMPFDLLTVLPTRLDIEVNGFNGGVLNGVPSAYHWYTERYGVKWPCGYDLNISSQGKTSFRWISTRRGVSRKATLLQN